MITEFGKMLNIIRIKTGDTAYMMASKLHLSPSHLSSIENGKRKIPDYMIKLLFETYDLTEEEKNKIMYVFKNGDNSNSKHLTKMSNSKQKYSLIFLNNKQ